MIIIIQQQECVRVMDNQIVVDEMGVMQNVDYELIQIVHQHVQ